MSPSECQELAEFVAAQFEKQRVAFLGRFERIEERLGGIEERLSRVEVSLEPEPRGG